jgi:hypothetical protein
MSPTMGDTDMSGENPRPDETIGGTEAGRTAPGGDGAAAQTGSKQGIYWILAGLVVTGIAAGYNWWKGLPK